MCFLDRKSRRSTSLGRSVSLAISRNDFTAPFLDGIATIDGLDLTLTEGMPGEIFWRQLTRAEFDISEMSLATLMMARGLGDDRFVALPIFTSRHFFHTNIWVRTDRGIESPADLAGKRIGVPE